jgi:large subunit ribosomal protein L25
MAQSQTTALHVSPREAAGSRSARRLRRTGEIPGVVYGGGEDPLSFSVQERTLRHALANAGAVMDLTIKGAGATPVVVKDLVRHPVTNATMHIDLLRVRLDVKIQATVFLELTGIEDAPGTKEGGVLEQQLRELNIEALPNDIPDSLTHDVSEMVIGDTLTVEALSVPSELTLLDEPDTMVATLSPPRLQVESEDEIESETGVVGEGADASGDGSDDSSSDSE